MKKWMLFAGMLALITGCDPDDNPDPNGPDNIAEGITPCENGMAGEYPCNGYDLIGNVPLSTFDANSGNDSWGWTDATTGKEYAIMGVNNGTVFVDISNAEDLVYLGKLPTRTETSSWRDVKVYQDHAFIVSEATDHGMQVFDLTKLRDVPNAPATFEADFNYAGFGNAHNVVINEESGYAYAVGTSRNDQFNGGAHFVDISDPKNPVSNNGYGERGYAHDAQVVTYNGPDTEHNGKEIFIGSNENEVVIADVTDKLNPTALSTIAYSNIGYTHQGWFTEDQRYFLLGDELDETQRGFQTRTIIFDLSDLDNPIVHHEHFGTTSAIDHNGYVLGNEFFLASYRAGVRVLDISGIANKDISEIGYFDTYPINDNAAFDGVWNVYPYFASGKIVVSDINRGLFIIQKSN